METETPAFVLAPAVSAGNRLAAAPRSRAACVCGGENGGRGGPWMEDPCCAAVHDPQMTDRSLDFKNTGQNPSF